MAGQASVKNWVNPTVADILEGIQLNSSSEAFDDQKIQPRVAKVTDGVYIGLDYGFANSVFLEGPESVIVVDTTEAEVTSQKILKDFRAICSKPISDIVYTDHHGDHLQGVQSYIEDPAHPPNVWAHISQKKELHQVLLTRPRTFRGNVFQFGLALETDQTVRYHKGIVAPVKTVPANKYITQDEETLEIAGLKVTFLYQPGEAGDELAVWLPDKRVLLPGDNFYPEFPNIYSLRGVAPRDARDWYGSLKKLQQLKAQYFVPAHASPIVGEAEIYDTLTAYISAIQFVHDQTIRYLNQGLNPDDVASKIKLPSTLDKKPFLAQEYGLLEWNVKGIYNQQIGWYHEDLLQLQPLTSAERSKRMVGLVGKDKLTAQAKNSLLNGDPQWSLELATYVLAVEPSNTEAKSIRTEALRGLASRQSNPICRNFYLTAALDNHGLIPWDQIYPDPFFQISISEVLDVLKTKLKAEMVDGVELTILLKLTDINETYKLQIQYSVLTAEPVSDEVASKLGSSCAVKVVASLEQWKKLLREKYDRVEDLSREGIKVEGALDKLKQFISYFEL